jgi:hypothetical protein
VRFAYCQPIVAALGCSVDAAGHFASEVTDFFADPLWEGVRRDAVEKGLAMRRQGWFGAAMAHNAELAYTGLSVLQEELEGRFVLRAGAGEPAEARGRTNGKTNKTNGKAPARAATTTRRPAARAR